MWSQIVNIALATNLVYYRSLDIFFSLFFVFALFLWAKHKETDFYSLLKGISILNILIFVFILSASFSYALNSTNLNSITHDIFDLRWILSFYSSMYVGFKIRKKEKHFNLNLPFFLLVIIAALVIYLTYENRSLENPERRIKFMYENTNHLALALLFPWSIYLANFFLNRNIFNWPNIIGTVTLLLSSIIILFTYSRSSWLGMLGTVIVATFYTKRNIIIQIAAATLALISLAYLSNVVHIRDRINYSFDFSELSSQTSRISAWKAHWNIFLDHPLFGVGLENTHHFIKAYYDSMNIPEITRAGHAHNQYLQILAGTGIFGFISFYLIFIFGYLYFQKKFKESLNLSEKTVALGGILMICSIMISSFTDTPLRIPEGRNYALLLFGLTVGYLKTSPNKS